MSLFQCRKYKGSEQIKKKAEYIYSKFKQFYLMSDGENVSCINVSFVYVCFFVYVSFINVSLYSAIIVDNKIWICKISKTVSVKPNHCDLTLLHSERPKLYTILAFLSALGLKEQRKNRKDQDKGYDLACFIGIYAFYRFVCFCF